MSEPVRPVALEDPQQRQKWVNADGTVTHYGHRWHHAVFMRLGAYNDDVWRALGIGFTGLTQINQVNQRVAEVEAATAAVQGAISGLRGDPRLDDAVKALSVAITALVQVQARASGESEMRLGELDRLVSSMGARLTRTQQALQFQAGRLADDVITGQRSQTAFIQRLAAAQNDTRDQTELIQDEISGLTTSEIAEGVNLYYTDGRADGRVSVGFAARTTSDLAEGGNLYFTNTRADGRVNAGFAAKSTSDLAEGAGLYFTDARARDAVEAFISPSASISPPSNGDMVIEATANTTLTLKLKGSDGVVRSVALTLA